MQTWKSRLGTSQHTVALALFFQGRLIHTQANPSHLPQPTSTLATVPFCESVCTRVGCIQWNCTVRPCSCCKVALPEGRFLGETLHATLTQELFDCHCGRTVAAPFAGVYQRNRQRLLVVDMHNGLRVCIVLQNQACAKTPLSKIVVEHSEH
jgi:hypothetical protein